MIEVVFIDFVCGYFPPFKGFWVSLAVRLSSARFLLVKLVVSKIVTDLVLSANCPLARIIPVHGGIFPRISFFLRISVEKRFFVPVLSCGCQGFVGIFGIGSFLCWYFHCCYGNRIFPGRRIASVTKDFYFFLKLISLCLCSCRISKIEFIFISSIWGGSRTGAGTGAEPPDSPAARRDPPGAGDQGRSFSTGVDHYFREGESIRHAHLSIIVNKIVNQV